MRPRPKKTAAEKRRAQAQARARIRAEAKSLAHDRAALIDRILAQHGPRPVRPRPEMKPAVLHVEYRRGWQTEYRTHHCETRIGEAMPPVLPWRAP